MPAPNRDLEHAIRSDYVRFASRWIEPLRAQALFDQFLAEVRRAEREKTLEEVAEMIEKRLKVLEAKEAKTSE